MWCSTDMSLGDRLITPAWFCISRVTAMASLLVEAM